jgi:hypothetical protein
MPDTSLARKMKLKPGARAAILNAPAGFQTGFAGLSRPATSLTGVFDWIQVFVHDQAQLRKLGPKAARALSANGLLWVSFPKGTSKIQTDLTRDKGWEALGSLEYEAGNADIGE